MAEEKKSMMKRYSEWLEFDKIKFPAPVWIGIAIGAAAGVGILSFVLGMLLIKEVTLLPVAFGIATLVMVLGYPYMVRESIISSIEKNFSDALKQMADTLKAGDTYESALREVSTSDYGRLSEEMGNALRRLEEGENLESALNGFADRVDSRLISRTITIILDSIRTGASLSEILEEIADDVRDFQRIKEDRKANTTMQFLFMVAAGGIIAPLIFGEVSAVMGTFARISFQTLSDAQIAAAQQSSNFMTLLIQSYLIIEVLGSGIMMSIIREGKINKSVIYIPMLLLVAFITYYASTFAVRGMLSGTV
jgi:flagellar protein FlaJ